MSKITLILVGDDANLEASRRSLSDFKKFNGNNIIAVNAMHSFDFQRICNVLGVNVYTPNKKLTYPSFPVDQTDDLIDNFYYSFLMPSMMSETEYVMFAEPDCIFSKPIDQSMLKDVDIIIPNDRSEMKAIWAYAPFWDAFGNDYPERVSNFFLFMQEFEKIGGEMGFDTKEAGKGDMRFSFTANSIIKTEKLRQMFLYNIPTIKRLSKELGSIVGKYKAAEPNNFFKHISHFSTDQLISLIFGLYQYKWKINDNGLNCNPSLIKTEDDLKNFLETNRNIEYIHSCKVYYRKLNGT